MTLQALRTEIGDDVFFRMLRRWARTHRNGNVSTAEFISFAEASSGRDLTALFDEWLSAPVKPAASPSPQLLATTATAVRGEQPLARVSRR
jgi:aminopeptidase N